MKYFYLYIFGLVCFIFAMSYYNTWNASSYTIKEGLDNKERTFVLMGDSVLNNFAYVPKGKSVFDLLKNKNNGNVFNLAGSDTTIPYAYNQIDNIPDSAKTSNTIIFLSIGGNDILEQSSNNEKPNLDAIIDDYNKLVETIQVVAPKAKLYLVDLYFPRNKDYEKYYPIIQEWNNKLFTYSQKKQLPLFKVSGILKEPEDFTNNIEPSAIGSQKIADAIMEIY